MTYLEQKIAIDTYSNYLKQGYCAWVTRILDDYIRTLSTLGQEEQLGEVVNVLYNGSYTPLKNKLESLTEKIKGQNAPALDHISDSLDQLIKKGL